MQAFSGARILIVDDDTAHRSMLRTLISAWGAAVDEAGDGREAVALCRAQPYDLILMDVLMPEVDGISAMQAIKAYNPSIPVLIMTAYSTVASAVEALKSGAYDYLSKPLDFEELKIMLGRALDHANLKQENLALKEQIGGFDTGGIVGASPVMRRLLEMLVMVAPSDATALICGESGTGKELIARAIHANSPRAKKPFVAVNCAALSENLLESELFGHEKGAFTGAERRRDGHFAHADRGTLFLDEIGEISPAMQVKLLRVIQEREFQRVGGDQNIRVDVRLVAATNKNLETEVEEGRFRQDLYYRLNVVTLTVPPLREREEDIPLLAVHFLERYSAKNNKGIKGFTPSAMDCLLKYAWPGNVRELENVVERAVVLLLGEYVSERELPPQVLEGAGRAAIVPVPGLAGLSLEEVERRAVLETLEACDNNKSEAARRLGVTRKTLHAKLARYGLLTSAGEPDDG
ncbi:sigma-54 dependent transcriptional regulator [Desulfovibrio sp. OttesenSCG-928-F20]|nr:sigma-54 dependent transcriptional regulator [Desulfovibrio sp. OttesenSCG-928-M16]MDL2290856.1 sigma-54 dependent transcriptional regulator [Desulfovibrio sp. OttesenSCG-928-F20]